MYVANQVEKLCRRQSFSFLAEAKFFNFAEGKAKSFHMSHQSSKLNLAQSQTLNSRLRVLQDPSRKQKVICQIDKVVVLKDIYSNIQSTRRLQGMQND